MLREVADASARRLSVAPMMDWTDRHDRYFLRLISRHVLLYTEMIPTGAILRGDAREDTDVNDCFGCDDPVEAAVEELMEYVGSVPIHRAQKRTGGGMCRFVQSLLPSCA